MKKLFSLFLLLFIAASLHAEKFYIPHYSVKVMVLKNGELYVTETIDAYFTQSAHGIMRQINLGGENSPWQGMAFRAKDMPIQISDILVLESDFKVMDSPENQLKVRIGNEFIEVTGEKRYTIKYHVKYAINHFADHSEFYWNLIGHYWATNIDQVDFTIELPTGLRLSPADVRAYTGSMGSEDSNVEVQYLPGMIKGKSTKPLASYQGMTLAFRVPQNYFTREDLGEQLSKGTGNYLISGNSVVNIRENGDIHVQESIEFFAKDLPNVSRSYSDYELLPKWEDIKLESTPQLSNRVAGDRLILYTPESTSLNGKYKVKLEYTLRGIMERSGFPTRNLMLPSPAFKEIQAAESQRMEVILPKLQPISADSLSANWREFSPWNKDIKPIWEGNRCIAEIGPQQASTTPLKLRIAFPNSILKIPDLPANLYSNEYMFGEYAVHLFVQPDATIRFEHSFSVEEVKPQTEIATMGVATFRAKPNSLWNNEFSVPYWGPEDVTWFEGGVWVEAQDEAGWKPGYTSNVLEGYFTPLVIPWQPNQPEGKAATSQYGWLKPEGDQYALQIPLFAGLAQPVRRAKVILHLPDGSTLNPDYLSLVRYWLDWGEASATFKPVGSGNQWQFEVDRPLRSNEWLLLRGNFPQAGFTGPAFSTQFGYWWNNNTSSLKGLAIAGAVGLLLFLLWFLFGRDRRITLVPQFGPPEGITPAEAGLMWDGRLHTKDLMTLIPYWAVKGHIQIEKDKSNFKFKMLKTLPSSTMEYELTFFNGIFKYADDSGWVSTQKLRDKFHTTYDRAARQLLAWGGAAKIFVPGTRGFGLLLTILGIIVAVVGLVGAYLSWSDSAILPSYYGLIPIWGGVGLAGILAIFFGRIMPKRGSLKQKDYAHLLGFREFIETVEADRLMVLVDENPAYFDETLPYAVVMGLAEKWAYKFDALLAKDSVGIKGFVDQQDREKSLDEITREFLKKLNTMHQTMTYRTPPPPSQRSYSSSSSSSSSSYSSWSSRSSSWSSRSASSGGSSFGSSGGGYSGGGYGGGGGSSW